MTRSKAIDISVPPFHVQSSSANLREGFPYFEHHDSVSALWAMKWRRPCSMGIYPFTDGNVEDFDPIFAALDESSGGGPEILFRPDEYAEHFLPTGQDLVARGDEAAAAGDEPAARDLYLRAAAVYRIARFPINRSPLTQRAWEDGKAAYERGGPLLDPPSVPIDIPFKHADIAAGDLEGPIKAYLRLPDGEPQGDGWPVLLFICGLDAYRTDHTPRTQAHVDRGFATLSFEIPGTGDCPAAPADPTSPDRLASSVIDWVCEQKDAYGFDTSKIVARGISTGGYYAFRIAHTHADQLRAVVAQGGGSHHMFDPAWVGAQNQMEYPFALADALAYKFGYRDADLAQARLRYASESGRFSLVTGHILENPGVKMLVINGMEDSIFPIEDSILVATATPGSDLIVRGGLGHMGNPGAEEILYDWIDGAVI